MTQGRAMAAGNLSGTCVISVRTSGTLTGVWHWETLLATAQRLFDADEHDVAVVVAATACEVVAERAMAKAFWDKKVPELEMPVLDLLSTCALYRDDIRKFYNSLTKDNIGEQPFFTGYKKLVVHRNKTVHEGKSMSPSDARADLDSAKAFVEHVAKHNKFR